MQIAYYCIIHDIYLWHWILVVVVWWWSSNYMMTLVWWWNEKVIVKMKKDAMSFEYQMKMRPPAEHSFFGLLNQYA